MDPSPDTTAVTSGRDDSRSLAQPLWPSTVWASDGLDDANSRATSVRPGEFYGRYANPTVAMFEDAVARLEGAEAALAFSSGMGAVSSVILALCSAGSHVVAHDNLYGGTLAFLEGPCARLGITTTFVDASVPGALAGAVRPGVTAVVLVETPSNPCLSLVDLDEVGAIKGPFTVVDSTVATPLGQQPLAHGVDLVVHSATKGIGGHNDAMVGVIAGEQDLIEAVWSYAVYHGAVASPHDALNALRGIRTLPVRLARQSATAADLARRLEEHSQVTAVHYPGLASHPQHHLALSQMRHHGTLVSFDVSGGRRSACQVMESLELVLPATSFGGPETLMCHPATSTHVGLSPDALASAGISDSLLRMSIGLEHPDDIWADLSRALSGSRA